MSLIRDFYRAVDVSAGGWVDVAFGDVMDGQTLLNESILDCELTFDDGVTVSPLRKSGATSQCVFDQHKRNRVSVRRASGSGGPAAYVEVWAWREP